MFNGLHYEFYKPLNVEIKGFNVRSKLFLLIPLTSDLYLVKLTM